MLAHYELYKMSLSIPGTIIECGVYKGLSLARFAMFRELFENPFSRKIIAFDTFGSFPETSFEPDKAPRKKFIRDCGEQSISVKQMKQVLKQKECTRFVELIPGDICETVPKYVAKIPHLKISLLNLDVDIYEPSVTVLEYLYPKIEKGGILILDNYGTFPGETKAVDDYFKDRNVTVRKFPFCMSPCYIIKDE
jgi:hypothetical protein